VVRRRVQDHQPARRQRRGVLDPAGRPERLPLHGVAEPHAELPPVPEPGLDGLHEVGAGQDDLHHAVPVQEGKLVVEDRPVQQGDDGLGAGERQRAERVPWPPARITAAGAASRVRPR
jgi:hypothetical protein